jgi:carboxyl-terminal processing protease
MSGGELHLPGEYTLYYPIGQSLDADHRIQLDSDYQLGGGIAPRYQGSLDRGTVRAAFVDGADVVLDHAVQFLRQD